MMTDLHRPTLAALTLPDGSLESSIDGGYPIAYQDRECSSVCAPCASRSLNDPDEVPQFKPVAWFVLEEDGDTPEADLELCDQCGEPLNCYRR